MFEDSGSNNTEHERKGKEGGMSDGVSEQDIETKKKSSESSTSSSSVAVSSVALTPTVPKMIDLPLMMSYMKRPLEVRGTLLYKLEEDQVNEDTKIIVHLRDVKKDDVAQVRQTMQNAGFQTRPSLSIDPKSGTEWLRYSGDMRMFEVVAVSVPLYIQITMAENNIGKGPPTTTTTTTEPTSTRHNSWVGSAPDGGAGIDNMNKKNTEDKSKSSAVNVD